MQDKIVRYSLRLNLNKPDHAKICSILRDLHDNFHTTINDFIIEALTYYIENDFQDEEKKKAELSDEVATKAYVKNCLKDHDDALRLFIYEKLDNAGAVLSLSGNQKTKENKIDEESLSGEVDLTKCDAIMNSIEQWIG